MLALYLEAILKSQTIHKKHKPVKDMASGDTNIFFIFLHMSTNDHKRMTSINFGVKNKF